MSDSITSVIGASMGASASRSAAHTQANAADRATQAQLDMYNQSRDDQAPWRDTGANALAALSSYYGLPSATQGSVQSAAGQYGPTNYAGNDPNGVPYGNSMIQTGSNQPTQPATTPVDYNKLISSLPGYQFQLDQGQQAVEHNLASRGLLQSGAAGKALTQYGQNYAAGAAQDYLNGLRGLAGIGQTATQATGALGQSTANQVGANAIYAGNANASGYINAGNSWMNGLQNASGSNGYGGGGGLQDLFKQFKGMFSGGSSSAAGGGSSSFIGGGYSEPGMFNGGFTDYGSTVALV